MHLTELATTFNLRTIFIERLVPSMNNSRQLRQIGWLI